MHRVLICDDHLVFGESLAMVFRDAGYLVVAATRTAAELLAVLAEAPVDVCVLDVSLPDGNILRHFDRIQQLAPGTPLVLLTGLLDAGFAAEALRAGARGIVHKGQHLAAMLDVVATVLAGGTAVDSVYPSGTGGVRAWRTSDTQRLGAFLTSREREVLSRLVRGEDTAVLARGMGITRATARSHIQSVLTKLGAHSRLEAATVAVRGGLVSADTGAWLVA